MGRPYPLEFRRQMVALVRSGRTADDLQREFRVSRESIRLWVAQAEQEEGDREALKSDERAELERLRRENRQAPAERDILSGAAAWPARETSGIPSKDPPGFVEREQAVYPIATMCRLLGLSTSGYYAWAKRSPSWRARDAVLLAQIRMAHVASHGTYGAPRIQIDLAERGYRVGRKRVARLMAAAGIIGVSRRKFMRTTVRGAGRQAPDLVDRNFTAEKLDQLWVADITYVPTSVGFLYLAVVLDACSRRIVGWSMATTLAASLVLDALEMALTTRRPNEVIHTPTRAARTRHSSSAGAAGRRMSGPRWARSAMPTTTPCARASSRA